MDYSDKKIVIFDLDGTLARSKSEMDSEMSQLFQELLKKKKVAVISGGKYVQFQKQFLGSLNAPEELLNDLYLFPTCGTVFYHYDNGDWHKVYGEDLTEEEIAKIFTAFGGMMEKFNHRPEKTWGDILENRGTQVTFSALGQETPVEVKEPWDPDQKKRMKMKEYLETLIPEFEIRVGGATSIDVTKKGIDKAYGIEKIEEIIGIPKSGMLFVGDALFPGGNDYPVKEAGVDSIQVEGPEETKEVIRRVIKDDYL